MMFARVSVSGQSELGDAFWGLIARWGDNTWLLAKLLGRCDSVGNSAPSELR